MLGVLEKVRQDPKYDSADLLRDIALCYEFSSENLAMASVLMKNALDLRPAGNVIKQKMAEYSKNNSRNFIMIVTYQRSGSTLLQSILNSSDECTIRGENYNMLYYVFQSFLAAEDAMQYIQKGNITAVDWPFFGAEFFDKEKYFCGVLSSFVDNILKIPQNSKVKHIGFKEVKYTEFGEKLPRFIDLMRQCIPNLRVIFNFRNLDDVSKSAWNARMDKETLLKSLSNFEKIANEYANTHDSFASVVVYDRYLEDIKILERLFKFLDIPYDEMKVKSVLEKKLKHGKK